MKLGNRQTDTELKPTKIPEGFVLVVDSREQLPLFKENKYEGLTIIRKALKYGDYSIGGFQDNVAIERKKLSDFYGYIGKDFVEHTIPKMKSMLDLSWVSLIIEASEEDVFSPQLYTQVTPERARSFLISWRARYGFHVYFSRSRDNLERYVLDHLVKLYNIFREVT